MATAQTIIDRAMRLCGALASGESPTSSETADCLTALNAMIDSWQNEKLMIYAIKDEDALTLTPSDGSYTIGSGGNLNTTRPVKIESAFVRSSGIDYPMSELTLREYAAIPDKTSESDIPEYYYYSPTMSTGTLFLYPVPSVANTVYLKTWTPIGTLATAGTSVTLPPGYEDALAYNLAIRIAPEFEKQVSALVLQTASETKASIKRINHQPLKASTGLEGMFSAATFDINTGE